MKSTAAETKVLPISKLRTDGGTQSRAAIDPDVVDEYAGWLEDNRGRDMPAVKVVKDDAGNHWLYGGFHRREAYLKAGRSAIKAEVIKGTKRDAIRLSLGENHDHGARRSSEDIQQVIKTILSDDEWSKWSTNEIAKQTGINRRTIEKYRQSYLCSAQVSERTFTHPRTGQPATMNTANIGRKSSDDEDLFDISNRADDSEDPPQTYPDNESHDPFRHTNGAQSHPEPTGPEPVRDDFGTPVPERLVEDFRCSRLYKNAYSKAKAAAEAIQLVEASRAYVRNEQIQSPGEARTVYSSWCATAASRMHWRRPSKVCPDCRGVEASPDAEPCARCKGLGWLCSDEVKEEQAKGVPQ